MNEQEIKAYFKKVTTNFLFFAQHIKINAREWKRLPEESNIVSINFNLSKFQRRYIKYLENPAIINKVILKPRQHGFTVTTLAFMLWHILYGSNENILYLIDKKDKAGKFLNIVRDMLQSLPEHLKPKSIKVLQSGIIQCNNNKMTIQTVSDGDAPRSGTFTRVVADEIAHYTKAAQDNLMAGLSSSCFNRIYISTPKQENDLFHNLYLAAKANDTEYTYMYYDECEDWFGSREIAEAWYNNQSEELTTAQIARELDCKFAGALDNLAWEIEPDMFSYYNASDKTAAIVSMDLGYIDDTAILYATDQNGILMIYSEYATNQKTIPQIVQTIKSNIRYIKYLTIDSSSKKVDMSSGISAYRQLKQLLGRPIYTHKIPDQLEMIRIAQTALLQGRVKIDPRCTGLIKALNNTQIKDGKIVRNEHKHYNDSFVYLVLNWMAASKRRPTKPKIYNMSNLRAMIG